MRDTGLWIYESSKMGERLRGHHVGNLLEVIRLPQDVFFSPLCATYRDDVQPLHTERMGANSGISC